MDSNQDRYFYLSGFISISLFALLVFFVGFSLLASPKMEQFAMTKDDIVNVSITMAEPKRQVLNATEPMIEEPVVKKYVVNDVLEPTSQRMKAPEMSDLFAQIKPQKSAKVKQEEFKNLEQLNTLEEEILQKKEVSRFSDKVNNMTLAKPSIKLVVDGGSTGPVVNEYHAKIQGLVYTYFRPPNDSIGQSAIIRMKISGSGKLIAYTVVRYGSLNSFNHEVEWLKDRLSTIRFPEHPEGREAVLEFILTAKEQ